MINKIAESIGELYGNFKVRINGQAEYVKLNLLEKGTQTTGMIVLGLIFFIMFLCILLMLCLALATWLYTYIGSYSLSFLATAGIVLVITLIIYLLREFLIMNPILRKLSGILEKKTDGKN